MQSHRSLGPINLYAWKKQREWMSDYYDGGPLNIFLLCRTFLTDVEIALICVFSILFFFALVFLCIWVCLYGWVPNWPLTVDWISPFGFKIMLIYQNKGLPCTTSALHSGWSRWCIRDVWFGRLEASLIIFKILIVFIPYFLPQKTHPLCISFLIFPKTRGIPYYFQNFDSFYP